MLIDSGGSDAIWLFEFSNKNIVTPENFFTVKDSLLANDLTPDHSQITMEPANRVELNLEDAEKFMKLIERLEDLDDTQEVYHNAEISDEILSEL